MNNKKVKFAKDFMNSMKDPDVCSVLMKDMIDPAVLIFISEYASKVAQTEGRSGIDTESISISSMILGYMLKGHIDRQDLNETISFTDTDYL
jgi:hypothetical protein